MLSFIRAEEEEKRRRTEKEISESEIGKNGERCKLFSFISFKSGLIKSKISDHPATL